MGNGSDGGGKGVETVLDAAGRADAARHWWRDADMTFGTAVGAEALEGLARKHQQRVGRPLHHASLRARRPRAPLKYAFSRTWAYWHWVRVRPFISGPIWAAR